MRSPESELSCAVHAARGTALSIKSGVGDESATVNSRSPICAADRRSYGASVDQAWAEIAGNFGDSPSEIQSATLSLARAMVSVAPEAGADVATLKARALQRMALSYRERSAC